LDEELPCVYYNTWMCHLPHSGSFVTEVGNDQFLDVLSERYDEDAVQQWKVRGIRLRITRRQPCASPRGVRFKPPLGLSTAASTHHVWAGVSRCA